MTQEKNKKYIEATLSYGMPLVVDSEHYKYKELLDAMGPSYILTLDKDADQTELWEKAYNMNVKYGVQKYTLQNNHQYIMPYFEDNDFITSDFRGTCIGMQIPSDIIVSAMHDITKDKDVNINISGTNNYFNFLPNDTMLDANNNFNNVIKHNELLDEIVEEIFDLKKSYEENLNIETNTLKKQR